MSRAQPWGGPPVGGFGRPCVANACFFCTPIRGPGDTRSARERPPMAWPCTVRRMTRMVRAKLPRGAGRQCGRTIACGGGPMLPGRAGVRGRRRVVRDRPGRCPRGPSSQGRGPHTFPVDDARVMRQGGLWDHMSSKQTRTAARLDHPKRLLAGF